jgi:hypothetical protein
MKDPAYAAKLEKAIAEKYGAEAVVNPRSLWTPEDEEKYQVAERAPTVEPTPVEEEKEGYVFEVAKLLRRDTRVCSKCGTYSLKSQDGLYLTKFSMCYRCFLKEEVVMRWKGRIK